MKIILLGVWLTCGSDAATTHYAIQSRNAREVLIPSQNVYVIDSIAGGEAAGSTYSLLKLNKTHPRLAKAVGIAMIAVRGVVVYHNVNQLRK